MKAIELTQKDSKGRYVVNLPKALPKWAEHIAGVLDGESIEVPAECRELHTEAIGLGSDAFRLVITDKDVDSDLLPVYQQALIVTSRWFSIEFRLDVRKVLNG